MIYLLRKLSSWLMPTVCILCRNPAKQQHDLCLPCLQNLPTLIHSCAYCANLLPTLQQKAVCGQCLQQKPSFDTTHGLFHYQPPIPKLIRDLKFHYALANAKLFGALLAEKIIHAWYQDLDLPTAIIPIPLHNQRLKERGFNQAIEIARPIAKTLNLPLLTHHVIRKKHTTAQATLPAPQRKQNMKDAFLISKPIRHQHVAVVDDVITTGNTVEEFCRLLKKHGIEKISVWCCARRSF